MGVATILNLNRNACKYDHPLPNMLKLHCMVLQCVSIAFRHFLDNFFYLVWQSLEKNRRNNVRESGKGFRLNFLYQHAEWTTSMSLTLGNFDFHFQLRDMDRSSLQPQVCN